MKCFSFFRSRAVKNNTKNDEGSTRSDPTSNSFDPSKQFDSFSLHSEDSSSIASTSNKSTGRNSFTSLLQRSSSLRAFSFSELKTATKNFSGSSKIGEGGFGCVYKGLIRCYENDQEKKLQVAVKLLETRGFQGHKEWVAEVNFLGIVQHPSIVKLVGYCVEDEGKGIQRLLVYEYMPNGSVDGHLSTKSSTTLSWFMRLRVARDAARGLAHIHESMDFQIILRDFKSSNILLDKNWNAKLSDFGLARLGPEEGFTHVTTGVVGTYGYAAPEYMETGQLTSKSDVWSYGVFLYELITGRRPMDGNRPSREKILLTWIKPYLSSEKKFRHIVDTRIDPKENCFESAYKLAGVANSCLKRHPKSRPKMSEVSRLVNTILMEAENAFERT